jgi:hypothetical protein
MDITGWHKSSKSGSQANCVEVGQTPDGRSVGVRDTKDDAGTTLVFARADWAIFVQDVKNGRFDG